jgi:hypothetical protein
METPGALDESGHDLPDGRVPRLETEHAIDGDAGDGGRGPDGRRRDP